MDKENKLYQVTCFINPLIDTEQLKNEINKIKQWLTDQKGIILSEDELSVDNIEKRRIAYPIRKLKEAFYLDFGFLIDSALVESFRDYLKLEKNMLRCMIVAKQKPKTVSKEIIDYKATEKIKALSPKSDKVAKMTDKEKKNIIREDEKTVEKEKIKIDDLDKKLDEILSQ